ncbi:MAG: hypothetical protein IJ309_02795 [Clostridia bacterium]|nr:hypothetical protein [Clostridia bacterium]
MKKLLIAISILLVLSIMIVACDIIPSGDELSSGNEDGGELNPDNNDTVDTSIKIEDDVDREDKDSEFPFEAVIVERDGYDIVAAGKYYGNDFDNVKYYGSYYRIIDNYDDFSELTAWGETVDKSLFDDNFILVLHSYKRAYDTYYTHSKYNELNGKGLYTNFGLNKTGILTISEGKSGSDRAVIGEEPIYIEDYETVLPIETKETIYLVIPKSELPNDITVNGEIILKLDIIIDL